jgi:hypothetical protein
MTRGHVELNRRCNQACVFCGRQGLAPLEAPSVEERLRALRERTDQVTFVGGEPTLEPDLVTFVARARSLGFTRIGLQTNGVKLADEGLATALASAGVTDLHLTLLGADAAVHDYHTATPGSFAATLTAMALARARGVELVVSTVLTRSNFRVLASLPQLLASKGVVAWQVAVVNVAGSAVGALDRVVPRLALALPYALHALEGARRLGLEVFVRDAPLCLLGPFAAVSLGGGSSDERRFGVACQACPARARCGGVDPLYLARFGDDELAALGAPAQPRASRWGHLFPGAGALFVPASVTVPTPPARAREALPELGKSQAARAEVGGRERRSGEALKEILPELFE